MAYFGHSIENSPNLCLSFLRLTVFILTGFFFVPQAAGKYKQEGKNYVVNDGDIIFFKFNAGAGLTEKKKAKW